ncbi:bi-domain-containing oxidoreductase [Acidobacteriota bacterium]
MKQLIQTLKSGNVQVLDVPPPVLGRGMILIQNYFSAISPGTEGSSVQVAQKSLIGKAKERPQQVKQAIESLKQKGPLQTYRIVKNKLETYSTLGYSCAGIVIEVPSDIKGICVGDFVGCGGVGYANHGEVVAVPYHLCVKLPTGANLKNAAYNTLGAIALQGVRQADLKLGETGVVIGLGLIGQLTCLILKASGVKVIGIDLDSNMVSIAGQHCADHAMERNAPTLVDEVLGLTKGVGADAIIITAATSSLDPIDLAGVIARKRGRVIIVGDVPTGFQREHYYKKELELRMSCSYGPGRYDIEYEEKGIDYPIGYVRWTENRNMIAFQEILHSGKIEIDYLTTHVFELCDAHKAYDLILNRDEPFLGVLIKYPSAKISSLEKIQTKKSSCEKNINIAFLGIGNYAMSYLLPNIPKDRDIAFKGTLDTSGAIARTAADKYGFEFCTSNKDDIFDDEKINTVFIATRHDSHADYVISSLSSKKHTYVEKPLCLNQSELAEIKNIYETANKMGPSSTLMVGFNRRFSPVTKILKKYIENGPMSVIYRINAGAVPPNAWTQNKDIGGGRIIGEMCHFVDYLTFITGSLPEYVYASVLPDPYDVEDTVIVNLKFRNGSIGTIAYFSNGPDKLFKEYIEVYKSGATAIISDFKNIEIYGKGRTFKKKLLQQDKGQKMMIEEFINAIKEGKTSPIKFEEIYTTTLTTFRIIDSIRMNSGVPVI